MPTKIVTQGMVLDAVVNKMAADKGVNISEEERERLTKELEERIDQAMVMALPDAKLVELDRILEGEVDDAAVEKLFAEAGVDFGAVIETEIEKFRGEFLGSAQGNEGGQA